MFYMYTDEAIKTGYPNDRIFIIVGTDKSNVEPFPLLYSALKSKITSKGLTVPWNGTIKSVGGKVVEKLAKTFKIQKSLKSYSHDGFYIKFFNFNEQPNHFKLVSESEIVQHIHAKIRVKALLKTLSALELKALAGELFKNK